MSTDNLPAVRYGVSDIAEMAKNVARSNLFGMNEPQMFTLMLLAQSKGLHPIQAVERYHVIQNRPAMKADAMLAEFQAHGGVIEWHQHDHLKCEATFTCPGVKTPTTVSWSIEDAKKAELTKNAMYSKYPRQMLRSRVISEGIRMVMPGILSGIYTPEEVADFEPIQARATLHQDRPTGPSLPELAHQVASTKETKRFEERARDYCRAVNARWADKALPPDELVNVFHLTNHMLKEAGITFADGGKHNDRMRAAAQLWLADEASTVAGWKSYVARLADEAVRDATDTGTAEDQAELVAVGADQESQDEAPVGREPGCDDDK